MLKLVVFQPGQPAREVEIAGNSATVGRHSSCDVVIDQQVISNRHLRILHGVVVVDLGSSNGSFLDGTRLTEAQVLRGEKLALSKSGIELQVDVDDADFGEMTQPEGVFADSQESLRSEYALLEAEAARVKQELAALQGMSVQKDELVARLRGENQGLEQRLESLKRQTEEREEDDGGSVQARLAMERLERVNTLNEKLQADIAELRAQLDGEVLESASETERAALPAQAEAFIQQLQNELTELRGELEEARASAPKDDAAARQAQDQSGLIRRLRKELEELQKARPSATPVAAPDLGEITSLRARVAELEAKEAAVKPADGENAPDLFFKLQADNVELRRRVAQLEGEQGAAAGAAGGAAPEAESKTLRELMEARMRISALQAELNQLREAPASAPAAGPSGAVPPPTQVGSQVPAGAADDGSGTRRILAQLVEDDVAGLAGGAAVSDEEFILVESLRFLRHAERVVTRAAGEFIQLFLMEKTMLPDSAGSYRDHLHEVLKGGDSERPRRELVEYLNNLARWLVAALGAHRKAAVLFAQKLKDDLSESALTQAASMPTYKMVPLVAGNELWRRVQEYLQALSPDIIDERIDELARAQAEGILSDAGDKLDG